MEVRGNETTTLEALGEPMQGNFEIRRVDALPERVVLSLSFSDQDSVDQAVDRIRQKGISLVRLTPSETTLEDAFLKIVSNEAPISNSL